MRSQRPYGPICHQDGTVTYWDVFRQQWVERAHDISDRSLAAMSSTDRARVIRHLYGPAGDHPFYPPDWPRCHCGDYAMDGKATCGNARCL